MICPVHTVAFVHFQDEVFPAFECNVHFYGFLVAACGAFQLYLFLPVFATEYDAIVHNRRTVGSIFVGFGVHTGHGVEMRNGTVEFHDNTRFGVDAHTAFIGRVVDDQCVVVDALVGTNRSPAVGDVFQLQRAERNEFRTIFLANGKFHKVGSVQSGFGNHFGLLCAGSAEKMCIGPIEMVCPVIVVAERSFEKEEFSVGQIYIKRHSLVAAIHHARGFHLSRTVFLDQHHVIAHNGVVGFVVRAIVHTNGGFEAAYALVQSHRNLAGGVNAQTGGKSVAGNGERATAEALVQLNGRIVIAVGGIFDVDGTERDHFFGAAAGGESEVFGHRRRRRQRHREKTRE